MPCCGEIEAGMEPFKSDPTKFRPLAREKVSPKTPDFNRPHIALQPLAFIIAIGDHGLRRLMRLMITRTSSAGSTGLAMCVWKPAFSARIRSSVRPYAVSATDGV